MHELHFVYNPVKLCDEGEQRIHLFSERWKSCRRGRFRPASHKKKSGIPRCFLEARPALSFSKWVLKASSFPILLKSTSDDKSADAHDLAYVVLPNREDRPHPDPILPFTTVHLSPEPRLLHPDLPRQHALRLLSIVTRKSLDV